MEKMYAIGTFAQMTGIPVRTLHYYDEIGLLKPQRRESGHRMYGTDDMMTLQKILSLKTLGFSLEHIKDLLQHPKYDLSLVDRLKLQQQALEATRAELDKSLEMIGRMIAIVEREGQLEHQLLFNLIRNMGHESRQREWVADQLSEHTATALFDMPAEAIEEMDAETVRFCKDVKRLTGGPVDSQEAEAAVGSYVQRAIAFLDTEAITNFSNLDEEQHARLDHLVEMPFNEEESAWLAAVLAHYLDKYGMIEEGKLIWTKTEGNSTWQHRKQDEQHN